jgi:NAD(P)-dependent dehydrogenase (short-subunit alcohol dehydrogenase family)
MELSLEGKVVLFTGGSKGIGFACASAFAADLNLKLASPRIRQIKAGAEVVP